MAKNNHTIKITPQELTNNYMPALQQMGQMPLDGKTAINVMRNYQFADSVRKKFEHERLAILDKYSLKDAQGRTVTSKNAEGFEVAEFQNEEASGLFNKEVGDIFTKKQYELSIHRIDLKHIEEIRGGVQAQILVALSDVWFPEEEEAEPAPSGLTVVERNAPRAETEPAPEAVNTSDL